MLNHSEFTRFFSDYNFMLYYRGSHSDNPSFSIVSIVENNLALFLTRGMVKRFAYIVIEAVQNIERYSCTSDSQEDFSLVYSDQNMFHVVTQNLIETKNIDALKERLDTVNSKHAEELNQFYIECLKSDVYTTKGAGLGLIDMARKSKNALSYEFKQKTNEHSTYRLHIKIPITEENRPYNQATDAALIQFLDASFSKNKSTLFYSGDFSNTFLHALLDMLKTAKRSEQLSENSKFHHVLIELTQNMKRHGQVIDNKIPGYLSIEWKDNGITLSSYNLISGEKESALRERINSFNIASDEELKVLSQKFLSDFTVTGGQGLIDIALLSRPNKIVFDVAQNSQLNSYFYFKTHINYE